MRKTILAAAFLSVSACTPGDDSDHVTFLREAEPNDGQGQAQLLGEPGLYSFRGACGSQETQDWYSANGSGGILEIELYVSTEPPVVPEDWEPEDTTVPAIANLFVKSATLDVLAESDVTPEAPAALKPATNDGTVYVQVGCPGRTLYYTGVVRVP